MDGMKKIITWNAGGMISGYGIYRRFVIERQADFICLQETRRTEKKLGEYIFPECGYTLWANVADSVKYHGTAIYSKYTPNERTTKFNNLMEREGRFQLMSFPNFYLINVYMINSRQSKIRMPEKVEAMNILTNSAKALTERKPTIIVGDLNIGKFYKADVGREANKGDLGFSREEIGLLEKLLGAGFTDVVDYTYPSEELLIRHLESKRGDSSANYGYRFDYILVSDGLKDKIRSVEIMADYISDIPYRREWHFPIELTIEI